MNDASALDDSATACHQANAMAWNQTAAWYRDKVADARAVLAAGGTTLHPLELRLLSSLGPLDHWCDVAVHLQCAAGFDTNSLANLGASSVVGIDIADDLIEIARDLSKDLHTPATFMCSDVLDAPRELHGTADLVFTGKGAVHWMFDIKAWGRAIANVLRPGGAFVVFDFHPMMWLFRSDHPELEATGISYFAPVISYREWPVHHVGELAIPTSDIVIKRLRPWPPSAIIQSLVDAGLLLRSFGEYPDTLMFGWSAYPQLSMSQRRRIATTYSVLASKPR